MKHSTFLKFTALLMCTLSLFGAVASVAGVVTIAEGDLYNKTVEQMITSRIRQDGSEYADFLALRYASVYLGGVSEPMAEQQLGPADWFYSIYDQEHYGYVVQDAEGNELVGYNAELKNSPNLEYTESFTVEGRYMHLISLEAQEDLQASLRQEREELYDKEPALEFYDNDIPSDGVVVDYVSFVSTTGELLLDAYYNGSSTIVTTYYTNGGPHSYHFHDSRVGLIMFDQTRHLIFHSFFATGNADPDQAVGEVWFRSEDGLNLRIRSNDRVGTLYYGPNGVVRFLSAEAALPAQTIPEETVPETIAETVPPTVPETIAPTVPETLPPETWAEETWAEDTWSEEGASSASAVPEEGEWVEETAAPAEAPPETIPATLPPETLPPETLPPETLPPEATVPVTEETLPPATQPEQINGKPLAEYQRNYLTYFDRSTGKPMDASYIYLPMPPLTVKLYLEEGALRYGPFYQILRAVRPYRNYLLPAAAVFALLFILSGIYLVMAAGRSAKQEGVQAGGLNRLPLDLYLAIAGTLICVLILVPAEMANILLQTDFRLCCYLLAGALFLACATFVCFCFAVAAQWKMGGNFAWKNSLFVRFLSWLVSAAVALEQITATKIVPGLWKLLKKFGRLLSKIGNWFLKLLKSALATLFAWIQGFLHLLPLAWQWFLGGTMIIFITLIVGTMVGIWLVLGILLCAAMISYAAYSYGILADSTRRMSQGDLDTKVDEKYLLGCFKDSAADLNALAGVAVVAAQKQLKSERMKTELITNVSHDIKTPLTSIINYVDLLQKPHTDEEEAQYLEVLDRQSQRLKKLIDDLMDMSKANTGNMTVEITKVDAVESVNQALGEFADKLERAQVFPVFRHSSDSVPMLADGKLVWRVLSNLLGNAVKYAMPGTRLYVDLQSMEGKVVLSLKNISREELNVDAGELMERFVRGDDARNTEGSGLGLNIAKSLMELQKGQLQLLVDGDLFKVTLTFPGA